MLISVLTKASSAADAAVDASTPDEAEQDADELVCTFLDCLRSETTLIYVSVPFTGFGS